MKLDYQCFQFLRGRGSSLELFILKTDQLKLRPLTLGDTEHLHQLFDTDPEVWKFDPGYACLLDEHITLIRCYIQQYQTYSFGCFGINRKSDLMLISQCELSHHEFEDRDGSITDEFEVIQVMYKLGRAYWRRGYAIEAAQACVEYAFEIAGLR